MKAVSGDRPAWCDYGHMSALKDEVCAECGQDKMCGSHDIDADDCATNVLNSHPGEFSCFPYKFTWPQDPANPTTNNINDENIAIEV
mgnify:CR=1 FL=1